MPKWTVDSITDYCVNVATEFGYDFDIPVKINGRLTRTLGQVRFVRNMITGEETPTTLEISKQLIETTTDNDIEQVIRHELSHYFSWQEDGHMHGHDSVFKAICAKIGCTHDGVSSTVERLVDEREIYKYTVYCPECGAIAHYNRMCKTLKNIEDYRCQYCKSDGLYWEENK